MQLTKSEVGSRTLPRRLTLGDQILCDRCSLGKSLKSADIAVLGDQILDEVCFNLPMVAVASCLPDRTFAIDSEASILSPLHLLTCRSKNIYRSGYFNHASLKETMNKIRASNYYTTMPEMKVLINVAAAVGKYNGACQVQVFESTRGDPTTDTVRNTVPAQYHQQDFGGHARRRERSKPWYDFLEGLLETIALPYLGFQGEEVSLDQKAEILFTGQFAVTAAVLGVLYGITNTFQPLPDDVFCYDPREPFNLQKGWLLWAGVGLFGAVISIALVGLLLNFINGEQPQRETDALIRLLPLIGSSTVSTVCLVVITGVLAPLLEETVFRGFLMVSLTKWLPTPVSVLLSAAVFAIAHLTPGEFPQLFVLGVALGLSYTQTRNLLTPITIHSFWNSGVILLLTFLQLQGYDIREILQAS